MEAIFRSYWWLMFPVGAFMFGAWDRWLTYRRSRDHLDLIRSYTDHGKDVPPELMRGVSQDPIDGPPMPPPGYGGAPPGYDPNYGGYGGYWMHPRHMRRAYRRYYRWGPYWQWRSVFITGAVAAGFWWASEYSDFPAFAGLRVVAIILTCVCAGNLLLAILSSSTRGK